MLFALSQLFYLIIQLIFRSFQSTLLLSKQIFFCFIVIDLIYKRAQSFLVLFCLFFKSLNLRQFIVQILLMNMLGSFKTTSLVLYFIKEFIFFFLMGLSQIGCIRSNLCYSVIYSFNSISQSIGLFSHLCQSFNILRSRLGFLCLSF